MTTEELDQITKEAEKIEAKMNKIVDPLIKQIEKAEGIGPALEAKIAESNLKFTALQKQLDDLDLKLQKANVPYQYAPLYDQVEHVISKAEWIANFKETKKGAGKIDLKGIDLHQKTTATRV